MVPLRCLLAFVLGPGSVIAQGVLADEQRAVIARETDPEAARRLRLDLIAAMIPQDLRAAFAAAEQLWQAASEADDQQVAAVAAAQACHALSLIEGLVAAAPWQERAGRRPTACAPEVEAEWCLARAEAAFIAGDHAAELSQAVAAEVLAQGAADWPRRLRAARMAMHATPGRDVAAIEAMVAEARAAGRVTLADCYSTFLRLERVAQTADEGDAVQLLAQVDAVETLAANQGYRSLHALAAAMRAELLRDRGDLDGAERAHRECRDRLIAYGDMLHAAMESDVIADMLMEQERIDDAREWIRIAQAEIEGRGWQDAEYNVLVTRFHLALKDHDGALADELRTRIHSIGAREEAKGPELAAVRRQIEATEKAREELAIQLEHERLLSAERARLTWMLCSLVGGTLLLGLLAVSWRARRRAVASHRALAEQVARVEAAKASQAQLEERVRQIERLDGLGRVAAGIAHDFANLLTGIIGGAQLLQASKDGAERGELVETILAASKQGVRLCRQLQAHQGGSPLAPAPCDLLELVREAIPTLVASTDRAVSVRLDGDARSVISNVDRGQIEQVLLNLVQNAREAGAHELIVNVGVGATPATAHGVAPDSAEPTLPDGASAAVLELHDDGCGMPADVAARIFDPFFTTKFPGRGLGLAVVFGSVRRHGGRIEVCTAPERGTTFRVFLPLHERTVLVPRPPVRSQPVLVAPRLPDGLQVLIVDDEPLVRDVLQAMLRKHGLDAIACADGGAALQAVAAMPASAPLWVFVDLTMPGMDGPEVCERLRAERPAVRLVLMSGHTRVQVESVAAAIAPAAVLPKPFLREQVTDVVARLCAAAIGSGAGTETASGH